MPNPTLPDLTSYFCSLLFSDAMIAYYDRADILRHIPVHRLILSLHSPFFAAAFSLPFSESSDPTHTITLHDDDPVALFSAIRWCYGHSLYQLDGDEDLETTLAFRDLIAMGFTQEEEQAISGLLLHLMRVYVVADKYDIEKLRGEVLVHYDRLAPLLQLHKLDGQIFEQMVEVVYQPPSTSTNNKGNKLKAKFLRDLVGEIYPVTPGKNSRETERVKKMRAKKTGKKNDRELQEVERIVRSCIFKIRTVGIGKEWKREFMRDVKREVRREVKKRCRTQCQ